MHAAAVVTGRHSTDEPINDTVDFQAAVGEHLSELTSDINDSPLKDRVGAIRGCSTCPSAPSVTDSAITET